MKIKHKKITITIVAISIISLIVLLGNTVVNAIFNDETDATHINPAEIENSTIIVGTHLIHLSAINDEIYAIAQESASASGQSAMYYKSELANGSWYEISDASGISDITLSSKKINNDVIAGLALRYHTKSDGVTYDLMSGKAICVFDTVDPYKISELGELDAINTQLEMINGKDEKSDSDENNIDNINKLMDMGEDLEKEEKDNNKMIENLNNLYIKNKDNSDAAGAIMSVMQQIDSARRLDVYSKINDELQSLITKIQNEEDVNYALITAIGTCLEEVETKQTECASNTMDGNSSAMAQVKNEIIEELAQNSDGADVDNQIGNLVDINNIMDGVTKNPDREAALITDVLIDKSDDLLSASKEQGELEMGLAENESLASYALSRMSAEKGEKFIDDRKKALEDLLDSITDENLKASAQEMIQNSLDNLEDMRSELYSGNDNEMSSLLAKKEEYQLKMKEALDDNDLNTAQKYENMIADVDDEIDKLSTQLTEILQSDTASEQEKAQAQAQLGSGLAASEIEEIKDNILSDIKEDSYDGTEDELNSIKDYASIAPELSLKALEEIYKKLSNKLYLESDTKNESTISDLMGKVEDIVSDASALAQNQPDENSLLTIIENMLGSSFEDASDVDQAIIVAALARCADEMGNKTAQSLAEEYAADSYNADNIYTFKKFQSEAWEFIPLDKIALCCDYRYVFYNSEKKGTVRKGTEYYEFEVFSKTVDRQQSKSEEMSTFARYQSTIYIPADYAQTAFSVADIYVSNSDYGIIVTTDMEEEVTKYMEAFTQAAVN